MSLLGVVYTMVQSLLWFYGKGWMILSMVSNITLSTHADSMLRSLVPNSLRSSRVQIADFVVRFDCCPQSFTVNGSLHSSFSCTVFLTTIHWSNYFHMSFISVHALFIYMSIYVIGVKTHHSLLVVSGRYRCNFGLEDKSHVVPDDMQDLLRSIQKQRKKNARSKEKIWEEGCIWV